MSFYLAHGFPRNPTFRVVVFCQNDYNRYMMKNEHTLREYLEESIDESLHRGILSHARSGDGPIKVKIRPVQLRDGLYFQAVESIGQKEFHKNYTIDELINYLETMLTERFRQFQWEGDCRDGQVLVSKKGKVTAKSKAHPVAKRPLPLEHNRRKRYLLPEGVPVPFLVDLQVMTPQGKVAAPKYDKFRQINRFLEFIEDILPQLPKDRPVRILDFGCGKSYLTFAMYYYLHEQQGYLVEITGLDLKADVIERCNALAEKYGYRGLRFFQGDIAGYEGTGDIDMVVSLHACDTATDYALEKAVRWRAKVILAVPCCQHELNGQMENDILSPVFSYGILKERFAALLTDGLRAKLLEGCGYETQILEFIDMEHTPKNLLIRGIRTEKKRSGKEIMACMEAFHVRPTLAKLLYGGEEDV